MNISLTTITDSLIDELKSDNLYYLLNKVSTQFGKPKHRTSNCIMVQLSFDNDFKGDNKIEKFKNRLSILKESLEPVLRMYMGIKDIESINIKTSDPKIMLSQIDLTITIKFN